ncbi:response regulator transcription factor [Kineococcus rhizosphaerae]|uniref:DNA-binding response OmpR family regulator n=1 Tax=Kineococcus rhizosphaerae TaxID=559628 RepID=A0A2T0RA66_9ACTN|nr:response regulator transcription factor [Kineococcus rhizosphaerae]PRY18057.1 DNA-binding response OmpR family regulator [Kineococcus rhizosphaerae]
MKVLLVEDEVRLADTVRRGLAAEGASVDVAHDGNTGFARARDGGYDVLVLDLQLPGRNGYEVCRDLRAAGVWTPVLVLTAKDGEYDQVDAFDLGADDYLTKPFSFPVLLARLRALHRRGAPERPVVLAAGDLVLDPGTRRVTRAGDPVTLTAREFALLEHLLRHRDEVVSKPDLLHAVWDPTVVTDPNVVEVYIRYLRKKIDIPYGRNALQTVRGAGYRLAADGG